jgi:hypothetical protein
MGIEYLGNGNSNGTSLGLSATEKVGFYGTTPVTQPASASQAAVATTVTATKVTTQIAVDLAAAIVLVNQLRSELVTLGIISGEA